MKLLLYLIPVLLIPFVVYSLVSTNPAVLASCTFLPIAFTIYFFSGHKSGIDIEQYSGLCEAEKEVEERKKNSNNHTLTGSIDDLLKDTTLDRCFFLKQFISEVKKTCRLFRDSIIYIVLIQILSLIIAFTIDSIKNQPNSQITFDLSDYLSVFIVPTATFVLYLAWWISRFQYCRNKI